MRIIHVSVLRFLSAAMVAATMMACGASPQDSSGDPGEALESVAGSPTVHVMPPLGQSVADEVGVDGVASTSNDLSYHGGTGGVGVETAPRLYIVFWGSQWSADPSGEAAILQHFFSGVGGSAWNDTVTQYCQGVASGTYACQGAGQSAGNPSGVLAGSWYDNGSLAPAQPTQAQLAGEAVHAAAHFGNTTAGSNASVQYLIATAHDNSSAGFGTQYCAWHFWTSSAYGNVAYTNLPYITDAGASCGADFNGLGAHAGITIVAGHEFAETETDPFPSTGWVDSAGSEIGDKCAWIASGQGAAANVALSTGTFPVQSLWSNAFNSGSGGCVLSYAPAATGCTPGDDRSCCPFAQGCSCLGDQTCGANGRWGACGGAGPAGHPCP
jgi:hypothetical protein